MTQGTKLTTRAGRGIACAVLCLLFLAAGIGGLCGCKRYEPESSEADAQAYYQQKYGVRAKVEDAHGLGSYGLFGYEYRGMEYVMSDGCSVIYEDDEGVFRDNAQQADIQRDAVAFAQERLSSIDGALTPVDVVEVGSEVYHETYEGEGMCWHERYEGDIREFLEAEWPSLYLESYYSGAGTDGAFSYEMAYDVAAADKVEKGYLELAPYFDLRGVELALVDPAGYEGQVEDPTLTLFDDALAYVLSFSGDTARSTEALRYKPAFVELAEGIQVSSQVPGVTLSAGDVWLEPSEGSFWVWKTKGQAAEAAKDGTDMTYFVRSESGKGLVRGTGLDQFQTLCPAGKHASYVSLSDGDVLYLGDVEDVAPWVEVREVTDSRVVLLYHTHFKRGIRKADVRVIGMAYRNGSYAETVEFESRLVSDTDDGWLVEVDVPQDAVPQNSLQVQLYYNGSENVTVSLDQEVDLPL